MTKYFDETPFSFDDEPIYRMSPEELRGFPGWEHYNDEEANEIIDSLEKFANILHEIIVQRNVTE
ncbi:hypothetical protein [Chitinophaga rhizosphaerae]|uniref:hypothetical protein n=1 Tax=Chitinophaga rhizosphaerae TaxID=1864947 RepID=UPI000F7FFD0B|nr:hypothetical protein [Chitinophaga rhizosphaerae]